MEGREENDGWSAASRRSLEALRAELDALVPAPPAALVLLGDLFAVPAPGPRLLLDFLRLTEGVRRAGIPTFVVPGPMEVPELPGTGREESGVVPLLAQVPGVTIGGNHSIHPFPEAGFALHLLPAGASLPRTGRGGAPSRRRSGLRSVLVGPLLLAPEEDAEDRDGPMSLRLSEGEWSRVVVHRWIGEGPPPSAVVVAGGRESSGEAWGGGWTLTRFPVEGGGTDSRRVGAIPKIGTAAIRVPVGVGSEDRIRRTNVRLREAVEGIPEGGAQAWLRLTVTGIRAEERAELDRPLLARLRRDAAHLELVLRSESDPDGEGGRRSSALVRSGTPGGGRVEMVVGGEWEDRISFLVERIPATEREGTHPLRFLFLDRGECRGGEALLTAGVTALVETRELSGTPPETERERAAPGESDTGSGDEALQATLLRIRSLRAETVEMDGEVEARIVDWLRDRQDAETQLLALRDEARSLRVRLREMERQGAEGLCPTCGKPLDQSLADVLAALRERWEALVQDGRWRRRRREQLDEKPEALRALELRARIAHAELESAMEEAERIRARLDIPENRRREHGRGGAGRGDGESEGAVRALVLDRASDLLNEWSRGCISGIVLRPGRGFRMVRDGRFLHPERAAERAAIRLAIRLALVERAAASREAPGFLLLADPLDDLDPGIARGAMVSLRRVAPECPLLLLSSGGSPRQYRDGSVDRLWSVGADWLRSDRPPVAILPGPRPFRWGAVRT